MKPFQFGILGAGGIAHKFCGAVGQIEGARVAAVASKDQRRAWHFAQRHKIEDFYDSYEQLLSRDDLDAIYIATTHNFHYENIMRCLAHNKPVLCEKSMVPTAAQANEIFSLAKEKNLFVMEAMWSRFLPHINQARQWLREGRIGSLETAACSIGFCASKDPAHRINDPALGGGALYDIGVYAIELMTYLIDEPVLDVQAMLTRSETGVDKTDHILLRFPSCTAALHATTASAIREALCLYGSEGYIRIPRAHCSHSCTLYSKKGIPVKRFCQSYGNGFTFEVRETIRCIQSGRLESEVVPHGATLQCAEIFDRCLAGWEYGVKSGEQPGKTGHPF